MKYYIAQFEYAVFGIGDTAEAAMIDAKKNGLVFEIENVKQLKRGNLSSIHNGDIVLAQENEFNLDQLNEMSRHYTQNVTNTWGVLGD